MRIIPCIAVIHHDSLDPESTPRVLILHRKESEGRWANMWCLPGGKMEPGESELQCATRELYEETGLCLDLSGARRVPIICRGNPDISFELFMHHIHSEEPPAITLEEACFARFGWVSWSTLAFLYDAYVLMEPATVLTSRNSLKE